MQQVLCAVEQDPVQICVADVLQMWFGGAPEHSRGDQGDRDAGTDVVGGADEQFTQAVGDVLEFLMRLHQRYPRGTALEH